MPGEHEDLWVSGMAAPQGLPRPATWWGLFVGVPTGNLARHPKRYTCQSIQPRYPPSATPFRPTLVCETPSNRQNPALRTILYKSCGEADIVATPFLPALADLKKVPAGSQSFDRGDVSRSGVPSALRMLDERAAGVTLNQAQGNPRQPNLIFHGFEASPLVGNAQGLAVYVNGSRFNQLFGNTTNWDLIPDIAIDEMQLVGPNPAFGLNALGGAVAIRLKNGFTYHGGEFTLLGGSFGRIQASMQYGIESNNVAAYIAATMTNESGWRDFSPSSLGQIYGDLGWRSDKAEFHIKNRPVSYHLWDDCAPDSCNPKAL
jgi:TonB-dependent Receptor Plug Domain